MRQSVGSSSTAARGMGGLASLAVILVLASGGASAFAGTPEWFECVKTKGAKLEKGCGKEGGKGGYQSRPGLGGAAGFAANGSPTLLRTVNGHDITCSSFKLEGERVMPNLLRNVTLSLKVCSPSGTHSKCFASEEGERPKNALIESEPLEGELGYISRSSRKIGLKLFNQAEPGGPLINPMTCAADFESRWRGSLVAELTGAVNESSTKALLSYSLGPYLGEVSPGYTPETNPPLEGEAPGGLIEESRIRTQKEPFGNPLPSGFHSSQKIHGSIMVGG